MHTSVRHRTPRPAFCADTATRYTNWDMLSEDVPEEQRAMSQISQQLLRRCRMLVVCGGEITAAMAGEIGAAEKLKLICTTLDGLAKIRENENRYVN